MLKFLIFLFCFSCSLYINDNRYIEKDFHDNGKIKYKIQKLNDKIDGYAIYWDNEGNLISEAHYSNDLLHGVWKEYFQNGNLKYMVTYEYGLKNGYEYWFYENGTKKSETLYLEDIVVVDIIRWDKEGNIIYK